jgi:hypothetical protein
MRRSSGPSGYALGGMIWLASGLAFTGAGLGLFGVPGLKGIWQPLALAEGRFGLTAVALFFQRLQQAGGPPLTWQIYPHASGDGKALHVVRADTDDAITAHLAQFADIYQASAPVEVADPPPAHRGSTPC